MDEEVRYSRANDIPGLVLGTAHLSAYRFEPHYHLDCHIALVTSGVQRQTYQGGTLLLTRGSIQLMPPGEVHDGIAAVDESYTLQTFRVSPALLNNFGEEITGRHYLPSQSSAVVQDEVLADRLLSLHRSICLSSTDSLHSETQILNLFESLFVRLLRPPPKAISGTLTQKQLMRVRDFMDAHICEKIVLEDLANLIGLDRFRFLKLFKRTVGMTPHAWLLRLRLEKAIELIKLNSGITLTEIAHTVGFFDQSHFTRAFRQAYGVAPNQF